MITIKTSVFTQLAGIYSQDLTDLEFLVNGILVMLMDSEIKNACREINQERFLQCLS